MSNARDLDHAAPGRKRRPAIAVLALILALSTHGCGESGPAPVPLKEQVVTGKVTLAGGKPLTKGRVVLFPLQEPFMPLYGKIKADGTFTLGAAGIGTSVSHGAFQVSVEPPGYHLGGKPKGLTFPAKYLNESTSGLTATITPETKQLPTIVLK
jgi:hypothetical protein